MSYVIVSLISILVGLGGGGYLGYRYGRSVEAKVQAAAQSFSRKL